MVLLKERRSSNPLLIMDLANNHNGSLDHGRRIIDGIEAACEGTEFDVVVKFQYRELDSFIHRDFRDRQDIKYIKRFLGTRLTWSDFEKLVEYAKSKGFLTAATPFDEASVKWVADHGHDILKVASASFTDWPLWEAVAQTDLPIVASTAGASLEKIDRVVSFLSHRDRDFALMHCVAAYPTADEDLNLNRIDVLARRYGKVPVGYSTHEHPENMVPVSIALAKGAAILERHVGEPTADSPLNDYSSDANTLRSWITAIRATVAMCGGDRSTHVNQEEVRALKGLGRGVYLRNDREQGQPITSEDVYFAIPLQEGQVASNDWSKYLQVVARRNLASDCPVLWDEIETVDRNTHVLEIVDAVSKLLRESGVTHPTDIDMEISHHYGIDQYFEHGMAMFTVVNRDYCKKLLVMLPGQKHPEQFHKIKEETFHVLYGRVHLTLDGTSLELEPGSVVVIEAGQRHAFSTETGTVIEEISSTHFANDSFYLDDRINLSTDRKSFVKYWGDVLG